MENEIWKYVKDYEGLYQVSNLGRVKSLHYKNHRILKQGISNVGYYYVGLSKKAIVTTKNVHKLVAIAFLNHTPSYYKIVINHIDFNRLNNNLSNIELVSARENCNRNHIKHSSIYTGVCWKKREQKWSANIWINKKQILLGYFNTELDAKAAYDNKLKTI